MADCSATSSCSKLQQKMIISKVDILIPRNVILRSRKRDCLLFCNSHQIPYFSPSNFYVVQAPILICEKRSRGLNKNLLKINCWGTLVDPENTTPANIISAMDQVLLMVSAIFAYMAGAVPQRRNLGFIRDPVKEDLGSTSSTSDGRSEIIENKSGLKTNAIWSEVNRKLLDALDATSNGVNFDDRAAVIEEDSKKHALSLFALSEGPIWRLLWAALWSLQKEAGIASTTSLYVSNACYLP